jgi:CRP-like cAMP-binding protein
MPTSLIPDLEAFRKSLGALPVLTFEPGQTVLTAGSTTGQLFILRKGAVEVVRDGTQIAKVSEPGALFGELALLLAKPHTADVRALKRSTFHAVNAASLLGGDKAALLYVAAILAQRLDAADGVIVEIKQELDSGKRPGAIARAIKKLEKLLSSSVSNSPDLPYGPFLFPMY